MTDHDLTPEQTDALQALRGTRGQCPAADELLTYGSLAPQDQHRHPAHAHIVCCSRCQLVLLCVDDRADGAGASHPWYRSRGLLAIAATFLVGAVAVTVWPRREPASSPDAAPPAAIRGSELQAVAPVGAVDSATSLEWQSPIRAVSYRVTVSRGAATIWTGTTTEAKVDLPLDVRLDRGVDYTWLVEALDAEGTVRMSSRRTAFRLQ